MSAWVLAIGEALALAAVDVGGSHLVIPHLPGPAGHGRPH